MKRNTCESPLLTRHSVATIHTPPHTRHPTLPRHSNRRFRGNVRRIRHDINILQIVLLVLLPAIGSPGKMGISRDSPIAPVICRFVRVTPDVLISLN